MSADDGALFGVDELAAGVGRHRGGVRRVEQGLVAAIAAARDAQALQDVDAGLVAAALVAARALDVAEAIGGVKAGYLVAQLMRPYQDALEALGLAGRGVSAGAAGAEDKADWSSVFGPTAGA